MTVTGDSIVFAALALAALAGALVTVRTKDVMRLVLGLGTMLLALAGLYLFEGMGFLAAAQVFVYVGGVLVLLLFAIMLLGRDEAGTPGLASDGRGWALVVSVSLFGLLAYSLRTVGGATLSRSGQDADALGGVLLGEWLPQFEALGVLLLAALVAVLLVGTERGGE